MDESTATAVDGWEDAVRDELYGLGQVAKHLSPGDVRPESITDAG
ncbi:hypothetical protein ACGF3G_25455 [Streptomyces sp. NPDC048179]